jgi:cellulose synthase/poly-beta-1,6-N-acetylglucosamine synthase-like glycosyltransferase
MHADLVIAIAFVAAGLAAVLHLPHLYLVLIHLRRARQAVSREVTVMETPDLPSESLPLVCVQLPIFNEVQAYAALNAVCSLDWPASKLEVLVLDDSDAAIRAIVEGWVTEWRARGINVKHIWRMQRYEFKAGALNEGLRHTTAEYIAIFDVDYRPGRDFLRKLMKVLEAMPIAAFAQARLDYFNRDRNLLTRAQALQLDIYFAYEQPARGWGGIPTPFNGTCAVWRRQAIEQAGGWSARSLLEDLDLSLRAFARGWRGVNLLSVTVAGELPDHLDILLTQRQRWAIGSGQSFRLLPWELLRRLNLKLAVIFFLLALYHVLMPMLVPATLLSALLAVIIDTRLIWAALAVSAFVILVPVALRSIAAGLATRAEGRRLSWHFLVDLASMWALEAILLPLNVKSVLFGLLHRRRIAFARTPKRGG